MTMERRTLSTRMSAVRLKCSADAKALRVPDRMLESMRQSLSAEGYYVSIPEVRRIADETYEREARAGHSS